MLLAGGFLVWSTSVLLPFLLEFSISHTGHGREDFFAVTGLALSVVRGAALGSILDSV